MTFVGIDAAAQVAEVVQHLQADAQLHAELPEGLDGLRLLAGGCGGERRGELHQLTRLEGGDGAGDRGRLGLAQRADVAGEVERHDRSHQPRALPRYSR